MEKHNRSNVYNIVKFISVILVVVAHSTRMYTEYGTFHPLNGSRILSLLTEYIYKFHMPLFILVSGSVFALCIEKGKYNNVLGFISNKAKRLLIPYYFFGFLYVAPVMVLLGLTSGSFVEYCYTGIVCSLNSRHLWYILALFYIFILGIAAKPMIEKSRKLRVVVLLCSAVLFCFSSRFPEKFQISAAFNYQLYFFVGVFLHYEYDVFVKIVRKLSYLLLLLPFVLAGMFFFNPNAATNICYRFVGIFMILSCSIYIDRKCNWLTKSSIYKRIQNDSFGIYLFHPMIIYVFYYFLEDKNINPFVLCFAIAILAIILSILATNIVRILRMHIFIGETKKEK